MCRIWANADYLQIGGDVMTSQETIGNFLNIYDFAIKKAKNQKEIDQIGWAEETKNKVIEALKEQEKRLK